MLKGKRRRIKPSSLNLTSMMDMFTIMLVFLLFCFSAKDQEIQLAKGIELPESTSDKDFGSSINIVLSSGELLLEDKFICGVRDNRISKVLLEEDKIKPLYRYLKVMRERDKDSKKVILFQADKSIKFDLINKVMKTAAMAGFPNFKFAVVKR